MSSYFHNTVKVRFGMKGRGFVLGVWSSCQSVGNIVGALMVNAFIDTGFEYSFLFVSVTLAMLSVLIFFTIGNFRLNLIQFSVKLLVNEPADVGLEVDEQSDKNDEENKEPERVENVVTTGLFLAALKIPGVLEYAFSYFALKLVNYSFFFWLPYYMKGLEI